MTPFRQQIAQEDSIWRVGLAEDRTIGGWDTYRLRAEGRIAVASA
jgi:hypothetical protein